MRLEREERRKKEKKQRKGVGENKKEKGKRRQCGRERGVRQAEGWLVR